MIGGVQKAKTTNSFLHSVSAATYTCGYLQYSVSSNFVWPWKVPTWIKPLWAHTMSQTWLVRKLPVYGRICRIFPLISHAFCSAAAFSCLIMAPSFKVCLVTISFELCSSVPVSVSLTYFKFSWCWKQKVVIFHFDPVELKLLMCRCMDSMHKQLILACGLHLKQIIGVSPAYIYQAKISASNFCWCIFKRDDLNFVWLLQIISIKMDGVFSQQVLIRLSSNFV